MERNYLLIGVCVSTVHEEYYNNILERFCKEANTHNCKVLIFGTFHQVFEGEQDGLGESCIFQVIPYKKLDGLLVLAESIKDQTTIQNIVRQAQKYSVPVVSLDYFIDGIYNVRFDYADAFAQIVRHVVEVHGCRKVDLIAGVKGNNFEQERTAVYRRVLEENGIPVEEERIAYGGFWDVPTYEAIDQLMNSNLSVPEAVVCENDSMAIAACKQLRRYGLRVPEDVIVTGLDGIPAALNHMPKITTAVQDIDLGIKQVLRIIVEETVQRERWKQRQNQDNSHKDYLNLDWLDFEYEMLKSSGKYDCSNKGEVLIPFHPVYSQSCGCEPPSYYQNNDQLIAAYMKWDTTIEFDTFIDRMKQDTINSVSYDDMATSLQRYQLHNSWICVRTDYPVSQDMLGQVMDGHQIGGPLGIEQKKPFTPRMKVLSQMCGVNYSRGTVFDTEDLIPDFDTLISDRNNMIILPLNFLQFIFGYQVMEYDYYEQINLDHQRRFCNMLATILRVVQDRERMKTIAMELQTKNEELNKLYIHDYLTRLLNRRGFYLRIEELYEQTQPGDKLVLFSIDMDGLKQVNDNFGHLEGDYALTTIANIMLHICDLWPDMVCARFGGDEFVMAGFFKEYGKVEREVSRTFNEELDRCNLESGKEFQIRASIGTVIGEIGASLEGQKQGYKTASGRFDIEEFINKADTLMYQHKETKKMLSRRANGGSYKTI